MRPSFYHREGGNPGAPAASFYASHRHEDRPYGDQRHDHDHDYDHDGYRNQPYGGYPGYGYPGYGYPGYGYGGYGYPGYGYAGGLGFGFPFFSSFDPLLTSYLAPSWDTFSNAGDGAGPYAGQPAQLYAQPAPDPGSVPYANQNMQAAPPASAAYAAPAPYAPDAPTAAQPSPVSPLSPLGPSNAGQPSQEDAITLIFKDGRPPEQIRNYALSRSALFVAGSRIREIPLDELDLAATERVNRNAGTPFQLPRSH